MTILVTGGAGYIGSAFVARCLGFREPVVVLDDLSTGHRDAVPEGVPFARGRVDDRELVRELVRRHGVDVCVHFAGFIDVAESVSDPLRYFANNTVATVALLEALVGEGVRRFVFSSTAAVYGEPERTPIPEDHPCRPASPYGRSKRMVEAMLSDLDRAVGMRAVTFRYFNAAGAYGDAVERHHPETHLIPNALAAAAGERDALVVHGEDFSTRDGTALRDYVHVGDLADAHLIAVERLREGMPSGLFNLGSGAGTTVREVIDAVERVTGRRVPCRVGPRRAGDVAALVADPRRAREVLGWSPVYPSIDAIVKTAWDARRALTSP